MVSQLFFTVAIALSVVHGVLSIPTEFKPFAKVTNEAQRKNKETIDATKALVNKQTLKMEYVLKNPKLPGHQDMIDTAFGTHAALSMRHIKSTVRALKTGTVSVKLDPSPGTGGSQGHTQFVPSKRKGATDLVPSYVQLSTNFYSPGTSTRSRAATLIHESTHFLANTGDNIRDVNDHEAVILRGGDPKAEDDDIMMYTGALHPYTTPATLNTDLAWSRLRDGYGGYWGDLPVRPISNMHHAAEAYAQFASMCDHAVPDATVMNTRRPRSLENEDWGEVIAHIIRRQACALPTNADAKKKVAIGKVALRIASARSATKTALSPKSQAKGAKAKAGRKNKNKPSKRPFVTKKTRGKRASKKSRAQRVGKAQTTGRKNMAGRPALSKKIPKPKSVVPPVNKVTTTRTVRKAPVRAGSAKVVPKGNPANQKKNQRV